MCRLVLKRRHTRLNSGRSVPIFTLTVLFGPAGCMQKNAGNWKQPNRESRVTTASEVYASYMEQDKRKHDVTRYKRMVPKAFNWILYFIYKEKGFYSGSDWKGAYGVMTNLCTHLNTSCSGTVDLFNIINIIKNNKIKNNLVFIN